MSDYRRAVIDACVLAHHRETDLLLWLATADLFEPLWSDEILAETERVLLERLRWPPHLVASRRAKMAENFAGAWVSGNEGAVELMTNHEGDRHVLATAVEGGAAWIITHNLRHFKLVDTEPHGVVAVTPAHFVSSLRARRGQEVDRVLIAVASRKSLSIPDYLKSLGGEFVLLAEV